jgi:DnaK suppressor protein
MTKISNGGSDIAKFQQYRRILERKAEEVRLGLSARRSAEIVHRPDEPLDFGDWCQKSRDEWLFLNQNRIESALFRELQEALRRLDNGTYGVCQSCQEAIVPKRLEALPWAKFCVPCQETVATADGADWLQDTSA